MLPIRLWTAIATFFTATTTAAMLALAAVAVAAPLEMTDTRIRDTVEDQLSIDQGVPAYQIDARVEDGIVTLSGVVDHVLAKERATKIAETVKGVRAVVNAIEVRPTVDRTPREIERAITNALVDNPATDAWMISPQVAEGGVVTLSGTVESWQERDLAETVTKGVAGVTQVENDIVVRYTEDRPDEAIRVDVQQTLRWNTLVDDGLIDVDVKDGTVFLSGTVGSAAERRLATRDAWTAGATAVDASQLVVARWTRDPELRTNKYVPKADEDIEDAVRRAVEVDPRVDGENVDVSALAGVVTLRGRVDTVQAKRAAGTDARNTVGVVDVLNRLSVRPSTDIDDEEIASRIEAALLRDPYVERFDLIVRVINGRVHLDGTVDSHFEKARADEVASNVNGVVYVVNNLAVPREREAPRFDPYVDSPYLYDFDWVDRGAGSTAESDAEIKEAIESELWWSPFVDSDAITVFVEDGVVTLRGTVESWTEYATARENAYEGGATRVVNDLRISPPSP